MAPVTRRTFLARTGLGALAAGAAGRPLATARPPGRRPGSASPRQPSPRLPPPEAPSPWTRTGARSSSSSGPTTTAPTCGSTTRAATCRRSRRRRPARVVWLTIISSAPGEQGHVSAAEANALTAKRSAAPTAVLLDPNGTVGKMYGATNTPHMYVIDPAGSSSTRAPSTTGPRPARATWPAPTTTCGRRSRRSPRASRSRRR